MLNQCARWVVIAMLILATGGHWALLQSVAWLGMTIQLSEQEPVTSALKKTFSGQHPCRLCKFVDEGRKAEQQQKVQQHELKLELFCEHAPTVADSTVRHLAPPLSLFHATHHLTSPPVPPPRMARLFLERSRV